MQSITSKENEVIKHIKKLKDKKYRDIAKEYVIEGIKLVGEAIQEKDEIHVGVPEEAGQPEWEDLSEG